MMLLRKRIILGSALLLSNFSFGSTLPTTACQDASIASNILSWASPAGCHITDSQNLPYTESDSDIGVSLALPSGVDPLIPGDIIDSLSEVIVYVDGVGKTGFSHPSDLETLRAQDGVTIVRVIPGIAGTDRVSDYSAKVKQVLSSIDTFRDSVTQPENLKPVVVMGYSLGGVASRIALAQMDQDGETHGAELFVSYDAPQTGASSPQFLSQFIPTVQQYATDLEDFIDDSIEPLKSLMLPHLATIQNINEGLTNNPLMNSFLNSGVWKDLLIDNALDINGINRAETVLLSQTAGYPNSSVRKIAVSNGTLATQASIQADQSAGSYYRFYGRTHSGSSYAHADIRLKPTVAGSQSVYLNVGATGTTQSAPYSCWWIFTCTHTISVSANLPQSINAPSDVTLLDTVPGSYWNDIPFGTSIAVTEILETGFPHGSNNGEHQTNGQILLVDNQAVIDIVLDNQDKTVEELTDLLYTVLVEDPFAEALSNGEFWDPTKEVLNLNGVDSFLRYTFIPTASAFGLAANTDINQIGNAYNDNTISPFDKLISIPEEKGEPTVNLKHGEIFSHPSWVNEIRSTLGKVEI